MKGAIGGNVKCQHMLTEIMRRILYAFGLKCMVKKEED